MTDAIKIIDKPTFNYMANNEIITLWLDMIIKRKYKSLYELKNVIIESYNKNGISYEQEQASLMALGLDNDKEQPRSLISKKEVLEIINKAHEEHFINEMDYFILLHFGALRGLISSLQVKHQLELKGINENLLDKQTLKSIIEELNAI